MLIDSPKFVAGSPAQNTGIEVVSSMPVDNLFEGREISLTAQDGAYAPGPYTYVNSAWVFNGGSGQEPEAPPTGDGTTITESNKVLSASPNITPYDIGISINGALKAAEVLMNMYAVRAFHLPENLVGSVIKCSANPQAVAAFSIKKNGTAFGSISISTVGVATCVTTAQSFASGDLLTITAPAEVDSSLSGFYATLAGNLQA